MRKVFKKHKTRNLFWSLEERKWVTLEHIPVGSLVVSCFGEDISKVVGV